MLEMNAKEFVKELKAGSVPDVLSLFLGDDFASNGKFLEQFAKEIGTDEKALALLSPFQQLWLLEASSDKPAVAKIMAKLLLEKLTGTNKADALKLLAYIDANQEKAKKEWQDGYKALLEALNSDGRFTKIRQLL
ncbi:MAG: hypothetical protein JSR37_08095 [Verrucomicrobia bacterium]|nr:hypothetical protein [Verrucomicrobiota bacterium]